MAFARLKYLFISKCLMVARSFRRLSIIIAYSDGIRLMIKLLQKPNGYRHITHKVHEMSLFVLNMIRHLKNCFNLEHNIVWKCAANKCLLFVSAFIYLLIFRFVFFVFFLLFKFLGKVLEFCCLFFSNHFQMFEIQPKQRTKAN